MKDAPIVLVVTAEGVGGAEKRLAEVWLYLAPKIARLKLLIRRSTYDSLRVRPDMAALDQFRDRITLVEGGASSFLATMKAFVPHLWRLPRGSVVHHVLQSPPWLHRLRRHRVLLSWVGTTVPTRAAKPADWAVSTLSLRQADHIDVLNPEIVEQLGRVPSLRRKTSLTAGGTIVDGDVFRPAAKRDDIVFMGRIERYKNALAFVEAIPTIAQRAPRPLAFRIYGRAADQGEAVRALLERPAYRDLDVLWTETDRPSDVLAPARIFVSLQTPSNYPSKALAEAMAAGCIPIISDSGQSRLMADPALATYVPERFSADDLARAVSGIMALDEASSAERSKAVRNHALDRFRVERQAAYFASLYHRLHD